jgi:predicted nucleotidyltransferase
MTLLDDRRQARIHELTSACQEALRHRTPANVLAVFLYGSVLGEGFRLDSDVDVAVLDRSDERLTWTEQARLMDLLERATGHGIDLRMLRDAPCPIRSTSWKTDCASGLERRRKPIAIVMKFSTPGDGRNTQMMKSGLPPCAVWRVRLDRERRQPGVSASMAALDF